MIVIIANVFYGSDYILSCKLCPVNELRSFLNFDLASLQKSNTLLLPNVLDQFKLSLFELSYVLKEIHQSLVYRRCFLSKQVLTSRTRKILREANQSFSNASTCFFVVAEIGVDSYSKYPIDKAGNKLVLESVYIKIRVDECLSALSTLGGAFSALGENHVYYAIKAGETSIKQLRLACVTGDPSIIARCSIYLVYSLCQRGLKRKAKRLLINFTYPYINKLMVTNICDNVLKKMYKAACFRISLCYFYSRR